MAEVYLGRQTTLDRLVAVKILAGHLSDDSDLLSRFEREVRAGAALPTSATRAASVREQPSPEELLRS
jgi:serine/threonine protein kinase